MQDMLQHGQTLRQKQQPVSRDETEDSEDCSSSDELDTQTSTIHEATSRTVQHLQDSSSDDEQAVGDVEELDSGDTNGTAADSLYKNGKASGNLQINPSEYLLVEGQQSATQYDIEAKVALAFAGDDVVAEFAVEKQKVTQRERLRDIDLRLPGWGEWSGPGIRPSQQRKKRSVMPMFLLQ